MKWINKFWSWIMSRLIDWKLNKFKRDFYGRVNASLLTLKSQNYEFLDEEHKDKLNKAIQLTS